MNVFNSYNEVFSLQGYTNAAYHDTSFETVTVNSLKNYYVTNIDGICVFDENWSYINTLAFPLPFDLCMVNSYLFLTSDKNIYRRYANLSPLNSLAVRTATYPDSIPNSVRYNANTSFIYFVIEDFVTLSQNRIRVYDINWVSKPSISLPQSSWSIAFYGTTIFVGTYDSSILVIENNVVINTYTGLCSTSNDTITSIYIDSNGYMLASCYFEAIVRLYHVDGTYLGKYFNLPLLPSTIKFDSKGRMIITTYYNEIHIYY